MNCTELFQIFEKYGGVLQCNYDNKICHIKKTNLKCYVKPSDADNIDWLLWSNTSMTKNIKKNVDRTVPNVHRYQDDDSIGFTINK